MKFGHKNNFGHDIGHNIYCINTVIFRLETNQIGNIFLGWKQKKYIGNKLFRLETLFLDWKQWIEIGNKILRLETVN